MYTQEMPRGQYPRKPGLKRNHPASDPLARFWSKVDRDGPGGCWIWTGSRSKAGYGTFNRGRRGAGYALSHRYSYEAAIGPIPEGKELDHLCRVRHCVNPAHLAAVTHRTNFLRGVRETAQIHLSGKCIRGHDLVTDAYFQKGKRIYCKLCRNALRRNREVPSVQDH